MIDASCGGTFMLKSENKAWELFENLCQSSLQHASSSCSDRQPPSSSQKRGGIYEVGHSIYVSEKVDALSCKFDQLMSAGHFSTPSPHSSPMHEVCALCSSPTHHVSTCPSATQFPKFIQENVNATKAYPRPGNDPYSNTYMLGWRNHPNFSWKPQAPGNSFPQPQTQNFQAFPNSSHYRPP